VSALTAVTATANPVREESGEVAAARYLHRLLEVGERGALALEITVEPRNPLAKRVVSDRQAQHVIRHQRLAVADRLSRGALARAERGEREVAAVLDVVAVLLQRRAAVLVAGPPLLGDEVVRHVGRQSLAPVTGTIVDEDRIPPPVVEDFVRVGRVDDEREPDDLAAEQRECGHAVARLPEVLDEGELPVGVRPDELTVHLEVLRRRCQVLRRRRVVSVMQVDERLDRTGDVAPDVQRAADEVDLVHRPARLPPRVPLRVA
jgi:hypothetical protein